MDGTKKCIRQFKQELETQYPATFALQHSSAQLPKLHAAMMESLSHVNSTRRPRNIQPALSTWRQRINRLVRMSKRNPKVFFRELRRGTDLSPLPKSPPIPPRTLETLMSVADNHDPSIIDLIKPCDFAIPDIPLSTADSIRCHTQVPDQNQRASTAYHHTYTTCYLIATCRC